MKQNKNLSVAVLIDGDNASSEKIEDIMNYVSRYGSPVIRRIYGDWTRKPLLGWKETAKEYGYQADTGFILYYGKEHD